MRTTSDKLREAARTFCWGYQGLTANEGKIHKDFFSRGSDLIVVNYDTRGRIASVRRSSVQGWDALGPGTPDKINQVITWFRVEDK